jgi:hypothetical protein
MGGLVLHAIVFLLVLQLLWTLMRRSSYMKNDMA